MRSTEVYTRKDTEKERHGDKDGEMKSGQKEWWRELGAKQREGIE